MCYCAPSIEFPPCFTSLLRFIWSEAGASQARQLRLGTLSGSFCCICKWSCTKVDKYGLIAAQSLQYFEAWNICSTKLDPYVHNEIEIKKDSHRFTNQLQIRCHRSPNQVESCYSCPLFVISALPVKGRKTKWKLAELGRKLSVSSNVTPYPFWYENGWTKTWEWFQAEKCRLCDHKFFLNCSAHLNNWLPWSEFLFV